MTEILIVKLLPLPPGRPGFEVSGRRATDMAASYEAPALWTELLPAASFEFRLVMDPPAVR
jgi:hypothetical protein